MGSIPGNIHTYEMYDLLCNICRFRLKHLHKCYAFSLRAVLALVWFLCQLLLSST